MSEQDVTQTEGQSPGQPESGPNKGKQPGRPRKITKVVNEARGPQKVGVQVAEPGEEVELTKADQDNDRTMKKVRRALETGMLKEA